MTEDGDLIDRLEEIKSALKNSIGHRRYWLYINNLPEEEQKKQLKGKEGGGIFPSPGNNPKTGQIEWRWHRLVHKEHFFIQKKCLEGLMKEIDDTITMLLEDYDDKQEIPEKTCQELLGDIMIKAHDMGVLMASKEEMLLFPAETKMLEIFEKVNEI